MFDYYSYNFVHIYRYIYIDRTVIAYSLSVYGRVYTHLLTFIGLLYELALTAMQTMCPHTDAVNHPPNADD